MVKGARATGPRTPSASRWQAYEMSADPTPVIGRPPGTGRALMPEIEERVVLERIPGMGRELTGARYAALGVLNEKRDGLERLLTSGMDDATRRAIGHLPRGRGVLGLLMTDPQPLRLADVGQHPLSYPFPPGHPVMRSFLGVPVVIGEEVWGNLYMTEKTEGEFTDADERCAVILAEWAANAIARLQQRSHTGSSPATDLAALTQTVARHVARH